MFDHEPILIDRIAFPWMLPGPRHRRLTTMRALLASLNGNKEGSKDLMVLRVSLRQQSLYLDGQHTLAVYTKCVPPVGVVVLA